MQTSTIVNGKRNNMSPAEKSPEVGVVIDGSSHAARPGEWLVDLINRVGLKVPKSVTTLSSGQFKPATHVWLRSTASLSAHVPPPSPKG